MHGLETALSDPIMMSVIGKIFKGLGLLILIIGFIPGLIIGYLVGHNT